MTTGYERMIEAAARGRKTTAARYRAAYKKKICPVCNADIPYEKRQNKYCSHSCAKKITNTERAVKRFCQSCGIRIKGKTYCSHSCQQEHKYLKYIEAWLNGAEGGTDHGVSSFVKRFLRKEQKNACSICKLDTWLEKPIHLVVDHIDGNPSDHRRANLRMICGNCDMQQPTYGGKNRGNGRKYRRDFYVKNGYS